MNKKASFILSLLLTALIAGNYIFFADSGVIREKVDITRVLDGDTVELSDGRKIRLLNINTPERGFAYSEVGKEFLSGFDSVELETKGLDKYGRTLGRLYFQDEYLNLEIVKEGMAHSYLVSDSEDRLFENAEKFARENEKNIWKKSEFYGCIDVEINKYDEYLKIYDSCNLNLESWTIKDESTKSYKFKSDMGEKFTLYSAKGTDNEKEIHWGRENIWNDDHDEIFILMGNTSALRINELESNPEGEDAGFEWIELYSENTVSLEGYILDHEGRGSPLNLSGSFQGYIVINLQSQWLRNSNETVYLKLNNEIVDAVGPFSDNKKEKTYSFCDGKWIFTDSTQNAENHCGSNSETKKDDSNEKEDDEKPDVTNSKNDKIKNINLLNLSYENTSSGNPIKKIVLGENFDNEIKNGEITRTYKTRISIIYFFIGFCVLLVILIALRKL